ncbi:MAG: D-sedoheptulose 7-phosphate isomerase [Bdellovibrionaceae bacterium]|nr:D-sedoheptulose 7-phosphate isomerase [Pseudobdellovibrionaceae bacterium]MBX3032336.1 D-sedoheptulose 7-phosphate isomerase [Pseudobdellovibrionaceae bacterium]
MKTLECWTNSLRESQQVLAEFVGREENLKKCEQFTNLLLETFRRGGNVFSCGNGGSHCDAMHFAEEWTGRYRKNRPPLGALALGDPSHVTCVSNDYGFEEIFARQLEGLGRKGDLVVGLSTSGNSKNVIKAFEVARKKGITTVGLLGRDGGAMKDLCDLALIVPGGSSDRIQEIHIKIVHIVIESVERQLFPENY